MREINMSVNIHGQNRFCWKCSLNGHLQLYMNIFFKNYKLGFICWHLGPTEQFNTWQRSLSQKIWQNPVTGIILTFPASTILTDTGIYRCGAKKINMLQHIETINDHIFCTYFITYATQPLSWVFCCSQSTNYRKRKIY